ncbi:MAG: DUF177 domain-containing protein [Proteobacteria bacterium]|nr:DUF177 domain-containing protein [Pseudomonadota bacterium]
MSVPEFSRPVDRRGLPATAVIITATPAECAALAARFDLVAVKALSAEIELVAKGAEIAASGTLRASVIQSCAISGEDLAQEIAEPVTLRFVPEGAGPPPGEDVELSAEDCDEIPYAGTQFDLGEALAQTLGLAIDPFATGPGAERARAAAGLLDPEASGPFAALARLKGGD